MALMYLSFAYTGLIITFLTGVLPTCIGSSKSLGSDSDRYIGLNGIFTGVGNTIGGLFFGIVPKLSKKFKSYKVVIFGSVLHVISIFLIFGNFNNHANLATVDGGGLIWEATKFGLVILSSLLFGLGEACLNTQLYAYLGNYYKTDSASAFALMKSLQSIFAAGSFFYSGILPLYFQLLILLVFNLLSVVSFTCVIL